ncbi:MAG: RNA polymerase sigma factor [Alphaproteobacteria bacterium]|nr:RNA polymerase sigma factor [Alphaproteobacteria bacterium]
MPESFATVDLLYAAQNGDRQAAEKLLREIYPSIFSLALRLLAFNRPAAEDVAQETCIHIVKALPKYRRDASFKTWSTRIAMNCARDYWRSNRKYAQQAPLDEDLSAPRTKTGEDLAFQRQIWKEIGLLPEKLREVCILLWAEGYTQAEAARIMDCAEKTIEWRVHDIKKRLREKLKGEL